jgi:hypothetical protein
VSASSRAAEERDRWVDVAEQCRTLTDHGVDPAPMEEACTGFDPWSDLERRAKRWKHQLEDAGLVELARFAAGLAQVETDAWAADDGVSATKAFEDRRFLLGDRIIHWAVPWSDVAGRCHHSVRQAAHGIRDHLLTIADDMRVAPILTGDEGLHAPGEDSFGPLDDGLPERLGLVGSGTVLFSATINSLTSGIMNNPTPTVEELTPRIRFDLGVHYRAVAARWRRAADEHPGSARLWRDLALRAEHTGVLLTA